MQCARVCQNELSTGSGPRGRCFYFLKRIILSFGENIHEKQEATAARYQKIIKKQVTEIAISIQRNAFPRVVCGYKEFVYVMQREIKTNMTHKLLEWKEETTKMVEQGNETSYRRA